MYVPVFGRPDTACTRIYQRISSGTRSGIDYGSRFAGGISSRQVRSGAGSRRIARTCGGCNPVSEDYQLFFDPFKSGSGLSANGQGEIKNKKLIDSPPVTSQGETIVFKYTVYKPGCIPRDPRIIIGE